MFNNLSKKSCIICKKRVKKNSKYINYNKTCDCYYKFHDTCLVYWLNHHKKCYLCDETMDYTIENIKKKRFFC